MMVADTSALVAVVTDEAERQTFLDAMVDDGAVLVSTATAVEFLVVAMGKGESVYRDAVSLLALPFITVTPLDEEQFRVAASAFRRYGRGRGHPARLNFGDTFAYALASVRGLPLLFKGNDFARTDITPAVILP